VELTSEASGSDYSGLSPYGGISIVTTTPRKRRVIITRLGVRLILMLTPRLLSTRIASALFCRGVSAFGRNSI
jgi:hypothetical protein